MKSAAWVIRASQEAVLFFVIFMSFLVITYPSLVLLCAHFKGTPVPAFFNYLICIASVFLSYFLSMKSQLSFEWNETTNRLFFRFLPFFGLIFCLFVLRCNFGIYDIFYPTDLLGMVERARQGLLPLSFSSFPDFPANYHQAFLILAGGFSQLTGWTALRSLIFLFPVLSLFVVMYVFLVSCESRVSPWISFLVMILFLFSSSFPHWGMWTGAGASAYEYLTFFDFMFSNSWVLGTLVLLMITLFFWRREEDASFSLWPVTGLLFCLISINATLFVVAWCCVFVFFLIEFVNNYKQRRSWKAILLFLFILLVMYWGARFIPSAFLKGPHYSEVLVRLKYFNPSLVSRDWAESCETLRLTGPWLLLLLYALSPSLFQQNRTRVSLPQLLFLFSIGFPFFVSLENIARWDAIHKFAIAGILSGFLFLIQLLRERRLKMREFYFFAVFSLLLTYPHLHDFFSHRLRSTTDAFWKNLPDKKNQDFIGYLQALKERVKIYPVYQVGGAEISSLASFSGDFVGNAYYPGFLVNIDATDWPGIDHWSSAEKFSAYIKRTHLRQFVAVEREKNDDFLKMIRVFKSSYANIPVDMSHPLVFNHYFLYAVKKTGR